MVLDKLGEIHTCIAGKRGLGVTVYLRADVIMRLLQRRNAPVCWIVIYKVGVDIFKQTWFVIEKVSGV